MLWLLFPSLFLETDSETVNAAYIEKALVQFLVIFKQKGPEYFLMTDFCAGTIH